MNEALQGEFRIESESDIVTARRVVRDAATTLGFGITDVTRLMDEMTIESTVGQGTTVIVRKWLKK